MSITVCKETIQDVVASSKGIMWLDFKEEMVELAASDITLNPENGTFLINQLNEKDGTLTTSEHRVEDIYVKPDKRNENVFLIDSMPGAAIFFFGKENIPLDGFVNLISHNEPSSQEEIYLQIGPHFLRFEARSGCGSLSVFKLLRWSGGTSSKHTPNPSLFDNEGLNVSSLFNFVSNDHKPDSGDGVMLYIRNCDLADLVASRDENGNVFLNEIVDVDGKKEKTKTPINSYHITDVIVECML